MNLTHRYTRVAGQKGKYNSAAHESLRAVFRCLVLNRGRAFADDVALSFIRYMGGDCASDLSPFGANYVRKQLERLLPLRGDFAQ